MMVTLLPSPAVTASECGNGNMSVRLAYLGIGPSGDCNNNGRLDVREISENRNLDYNRNGNLDFCDCRDNAVRAVFARRIIHHDGGSLRREMLGNRGSDAF